MGFTSRLPLHLPVSLTSRCMESEQEGMLFQVIPSQKYSPNVHKITQLSANFPTSTPAAHTTRCKATLPLPNLPSQLTPTAHHHVEHKSGGGGWWSNRKDQFGQQLCWAQWNEDGYGLLHAKLRFYHLHLREEANARHSLGYSGYAQIEIRYITTRLRPLSCKSITTRILWL